MNADQFFSVAILVGALCGLLVMTIVVSIASAWLCIKSIQEVRSHVNSRLDQLLAAEKKLSFGEGGIAEREAENKRRLEHE